MRTEPSVTGIDLTLAGALRVGLTLLLDRNASTPFGLPIPRHETGRTSVDWPGVIWPWGTLRAASDRKRRSR